MLELGQENVDTLVMRRWITRIRITASIATFGTHTTSNST